MSYPKLFLSDTMIFSESNSIFPKSFTSYPLSGQKVKIRVKNPNHNFFVDTYINDWLDILKSVLILLNLFLVYCAMEPEIWFLLLVLYRLLKNMPKGRFEFFYKELRECSMPRLNSETFLNSSFSSQFAIFEGKSQKDT